MPVLPLIVYNHTTHRDALVIPVGVKLTGRKRTGGSVCRHHDRRRGTVVRKVRIGRAGRFTYVRSICDRGTCGTRLHFGCDRKGRGRTCAHITMVQIPVEPRVGAFR